MKNKDKMKKKKFSDFSKKEQENILQNRKDLSNKEILGLIFSLYKKFLPLLLIFVGFIMFGAAMFYFFY